MLARLASSELATPRLAPPAPPLYFCELLGITGLTRRCFLAFAITDAWTQTHRKNTTQGHSSNNSSATTGRPPIPPKRSMRWGCPSATVGHQSTGKRCSKTRPPRVCLPAPDNPTRVPSLKEKPTRANKQSDADKTERGQKAPKGQKVQLPPGSHRSYPH
jgi:hypothetical protein